MWVLKPNSGLIKIDGKIINFDNRKALRELFGYVGQETIIINDNFYVNVSFSNKYDEQIVENVSKIARINEFIDTKENKYNYQISENGKKFKWWAKTKSSYCKSII